MDGKVALITGGSNGIGEGVARGFLAGHGARVVLADIDDVRGMQVAEELGGRFIHTDVTEPADSTRAGVAFAREEYGGLHLAHLNAGVTSWCSMGDDFDPEAYRRAMRINLDGVVYGIAASRPAIIASGGGTIVATASMAGLVAVPFDPIYAANKHAVVGLVRSIGDAYAAEGVKVNALCPSFAARRTSSRAPNRSCSTWGFPFSRSAMSLPPFNASSTPMSRASAGTSSRDERANPSDFAMRRGLASEEVPLPRRGAATIGRAVRRWVPPGSDRSEPPLRLMAPDQRARRDVSQCAPGAGGP